MNPSQQKFRFNAETLGTEWSGAGTDTSGETLSYLVELADEDCRAFGRLLLTDTRLDESFEGVWGRAASGENEWDVRRFNVSDTGWNSPDCCIHIDYYRTDADVEDLNSPDGNITIAECPRQELLPMAKARLLWDAGVDSPELLAAMVAAGISPNEVETVTAQEHSQGFLDGLLTTAALRGEVPMPVRDGWLYLSI